MVNRTTSVLSGRTSQCRRDGQTECHTVCHYCITIQPIHPLTAPAAWLGLVKYYSAAYRTGTYPTPSDALYLWSRPHPKSGTPSSPSMSRPRNADYTEDNVYAIAILASKSDVVLYNGVNKVTYKNLPAGLTKISVANNEGAMGAQIMRNGGGVKIYKSDGQFSWSTSFRDWNFNYFVGSA